MTPASPTRCQGSPSTRASNWAPFRLKVPETSRGHTKRRHSGAARPATRLCRHGPIPSSGWPGGWRTDKHGAAVLRRRRRPPAPGRPRCRPACPAARPPATAHPPGSTQHLAQPGSRKMLLVIGQRTCTATGPRCRSTSMNRGISTAGGVSGTTLTGTNALAMATSRSRAAKRLHLWTRLAFRPWLIATLATEAPGAAHSARTCRFSSGSWRRRVSGLASGMVSTYLVWWTPSWLVPPQRSRWVRRTLTSALHLRQQLCVALGSRRTQGRTALTRGVTPLR